MALTDADRAWLYREFEKQTEATDELKTLVREQNGRLGRVETRITVIETQRDEEAKQAVKRSTWAGIVAAAGLTGALEVVKAWAKKP